MHVMNTTRRFLGSVRWAPLVIIALGAVASCADASTTALERTDVNASQLVPAAQQLTPAQVLGIHRALGHASNMEASVAYGASDSRIAELANRIANARIAQDQEIDRLAASLGVAVEETPTSLQIRTQSDRDVAALRALPTAARDDGYVDGLVLSEARALGVADQLLAPNVATDEQLNAFAFRARLEWRTQLGSALVIQRAHHDWRANVTEPLRFPIAPAPGPTIPR